MDKPKSDSSLHDELYKDESPNNYIFESQLIHHLNIFLLEDISYQIAEYIEAKNEKFIFLNPFLLQELRDKIELIKLN